MADNYLEKRYDEIFGRAAQKPKRVGQSLDQLLLKNRSCRGYDTNFVVKREMLERIVGVNTKIASARNQQTLRFRIVAKDEAGKVLPHIRLGGALPELHLPLENTEPEAFIIICATEQNRWTDIDLGISAQSMLLKATEMGLAGIIIGAFNKERIRENFALPSAPLLVIAVGKSVEKIELTTICPDDDRCYFRRDGVHYVPKLQLQDLLIK